MEIKQSRSQQVAASIRAKIAAGRSASGLAVAPKPAPAKKPVKRFSVAEVNARLAAAGLGPLDGAESKP